jgi:AbrB family looped-hinge helix DNA binding protein
MKTRVSSKGQIVIPKSVRNHYQWKAGTVLKIEETASGVVLSPATNPSISQEEVFGCLKKEVSKRVSLKEMDQAISKLARSSSK